MLRISLGIRSAGGTSLLVALSRGPPAYSLVSGLSFFNPNLGVTTGSGCKLLENGLVSPVSKLVYEPSAPILNLGLLGNTLPSRGPLGSIHDAGALGLGSSIPAITFNTLGGFQLAVPACKSAPILVGGNSGINAGLTPGLGIDFMPPIPPANSNAPIARLGILS